MLHHFHLIQTMLSSPQKVYWMSEIACIQCTFSWCYITVRQLWVFLSYYIFMNSIYWDWPHWVFSQSWPLVSFNLQLWVSHPLMPWFFADINDPVLVLDSFISQVLLLVQWSVFLAYLSIYPALYSMRYSVSCFFSKIAFFYPLPL